jgi:transposase-like protein
MPEIPDEFKSSFLLGYFEGDGCVSYCAKSQSATFACQEAMAQCIHKTLVLNGIFSTVHKRKHVVIIQIARKEHMKKLYDFLYGKSEIFMLRKKQKFENIIHLTAQ